jgi:hypothetical protein
MARSYITYTGDGTNQVFSVTFSYIQKDDVTIKVNNLPATFEWLSDSSVKITPAPPNGQVVKISRITDIDGPIVDFQDGANLTEPTWTRRCSRTWTRSRRFATTWTSGRRGFRTSRSADRWPCRRSLA